MDTGGIMIGGLHSHADFGACISSRNTGAPTRKTVRKTVPHMTGFYDFSNVAGSPSYEQREVSYSFDLIGSRDEVQAAKSALLNWLAPVTDAEIRDDDLPGWHMRGGFDSADWEEDASGEGGTLTVRFVCQPLLEADEYTVVRLEAGETVVTNFGQTVSPLASGTGGVTIGGVTQAVTADEARLSAQLLHGENVVSVSGGPVTIRWREVRP